MQNNAITNKQPIYAGKLVAYIANINQGGRSYTFEIIFIRLITVKNNHFSTRLERLFSNLGENRNTRADSQRIKVLK